MLPGQTGLEALKAMRAQRPELPIVMITGYPTPAHEEQVLAAGATAFLPKPFDESELLNVVRSVLNPTDVPAKEPNP
jgi:CheY-like chemotaxis protein